MLDDGKSRSLAREGDLNRLSLTALRQHLCASDRLLPSYGNPRRLKRGVYL
jgi:hypothetical protein